MTKEEKDFLLKDLCARLPYGVKANSKVGGIITINGIVEDAIEDISGDWFDVSFIKPFLRPLSSMTEEEKATFLRLRLAIEIGTQIDVSIRYYLDFIYSHHLDMDKGLIAKGLAYVAPKDLYKFDKTEIV